MKKSILPLILVCAAFIAFGCGKKNLPGKYDCSFSPELSPQIILPEGYETSITSDLIANEDDGPYVSGVIEYKLERQVIATVFFGDGEDDAVARLLLNGEYTELGLVIEDGESMDEWYAADRECGFGEWGHKDDKKGRRYKECEEITLVIMEPLIGLDGCDYITSGIIQYYIGDKLSATFDYGDGTCDALVEKTTDDGVSSFSLDDYPEWN